MNLYMLLFEGEQYVVEADSMISAIHLWRRFMAIDREWEDGDYPDPETISNLLDSPVITDERVNVMATQAQGE